MKNTDAPKTNSTSTHTKLKSLLLAFAFIVAVLFFFVLILTTTTAGTRYTLRLLENITEIKFQGVSGSLVHQLNIRHVEFHHQDVDLVADDVELQWQPRALLSRQIQLDYFRINQLQLALAGGDETPVTLPQSLKLPRLIKLVKADQLSIHHLQVSMLKPDQKQAQQTQTRLLQFSALKGQVVIDPAKYQLQFSGTTPWGSAALKGGFDSTSPFNVQAGLDWLGLAIDSENKQSGVTIPVTKAQGTLSGNFKKMLVQAQFSVPSASADGLENAKENKKESKVVNQTTEPSRGQLHAVLTPFDVLPIDTLQVELGSLNPSHFYVDAPNANLQLKADFKITEDQKTPTLSGQFSIKNALPMSWNSGGIPFSKLSSEVTLNEQQLRWKTTQIELNDGGSMTGSGFLNLAENEAKLPTVTASIDVKKVNLLRIDSRLKNTQLSGKIQVDSVKAGLQFALQLHDNQPDKSNSSLIADIQLSHEQVVHLQKIELLAKEAILTAQGSFALRDKQEFLLQGEAHNFNPARWVNVPDGRIGTRFKVAGQVKQGWRVDAQVADLSGQFAGLNLQGESDFVVQEDKFLAIKKLEFNWGKNHLSAKGNWRLGALPNVRQQDQLQPTQLQVKLAIPDLSVASDPFKKLLPVTKKQAVQGSLFVDGLLSGTTSQPGGQLTINANKIAIPDIVAIEKLQATIALADGDAGKIAGDLNLTGLVAGATHSIQHLEKNKHEDGFKVGRLQASLTGLRHAHQLQLTANFNRKYQVALQAQGGLQKVKKLDIFQWQGQVQQFNLSGASDLQLMSPFALKISGKEVQMGTANWQGKLGKLQVQQIHWSNGQLKTNGQWQGLPVVNALKLWCANASNVSLIGDLQIDAGWHLNLGMGSPVGAENKFEVKRTSGDLTIQDVSGGYSQTFALGLKNVIVTGSLGQAGVVAPDKTTAKTTARVSYQSLDVKLHALGDQLGLIEANIHSLIKKNEQGWPEWNANAPLSGIAKIQIKDIRWLSQLAGPGVALHGEFQAQAQLAGTLENPDYSAKISGKELQVSLTELGVLLPNGILDASVETSQGISQLKLNKLRFSQAIKAPPKHDKLTDLPWLNETGFVESGGAIDLRSGRGSITTHWERFPFLQTSTSWLVASGDAYLTETENVWNLTGQLLADAAYFSVPKQSPPKLSSDVVVLKKNAKGYTENSEKTTTLQTAVDFNIKTGKNFVFVGRGLNTRLMGDLRIRIQNNGPVVATGLIQTAGGTYEGYGQQLAIERGILNFQGALDNPGLNVRAMRRGLPVEAGVDVIGTVAKPEVRLISEPNVPDQDKLSWMILGRASDQTGGSEAALLMSAASAIWGGDSGKNIPREIAQTFGLDEISLRTAGGSTESQLPAQTVAGNINNSMPNDQVLSVGKRITPDLVFSIERSLTDATNGVKLTWHITRRFSIIGRAGSDTSIDGQYLFSFD